MAVEIEIQYQTENNPTVVIKQGYILQSHTILFSSPTPIHYPSSPSLKLPPGHSNLLRLPGGVRQAGSCRRHGCREWNTGPAAGVGPGGSRRRAPGPAEGWAAENPRPAEPRSHRRPVCPNSTEMFHGAAPGWGWGVGYGWVMEWVQV